MTKEINIIGKKFGKLTVIKRGSLHIMPCGKRRYKLVCLCSCGKITEVLPNNLVRGNTTSCGCTKREIIKNGAHTTHGMRRTRLYNIWAGMINRTKNKNNNSYKNYGSRGIKVCDEWKNSFEEFMKWSLNNGYSDNLTIDRIDVNGNYCPKNCRWVTIKQQARNKRTNVFIAYRGETHCISEWEEILGDKKHLLRNGWNRNWPIEKVDSFYNDPNYVTQHNYNKEQELIHLYEKSKLLTIY